MPAPIHFGVCGLGRIGTQHCEHFSENRQRYRPVAFCDLDAGRAEATSKRFGGAAFTNYAAFLASPELELVIIATPSLDHARNAEQALMAGKIVLLEKPIAVTEKDIQLLRGLDREYPGKLYFCQNHRFEAAFEDTQRILAAKILGNIQVIKLAKHHDFSRRNDWQMRLDCGGGQLSVWGPHLLDQGLQLLGVPVLKVSSYLRRILTPGDADDHVRILLEGENGVVVEIEISNAVALPGPYCTIYGDRGTLTYGQEQETLQLKYLDPKFRWPDVVASTKAPELGVNSYAADRNLPWMEESRPIQVSPNRWVRVEIELVHHLYEAIRNGIPFPVKNADALEVARLTQIVKEQNPQFHWLEE